MRLSAASRGEDDAISDADLWRRLCDVDDLALLSGVDVVVVGDEEEQGTDEIEDAGCRWRCGSGGAENAGSGAAFLWKDRRFDVAVAAAVAAEVDPNEGEA